MQMVALDLDGTLVDQKSASRQWAEEFVSGQQLDIDPGVVASALAARRPKGEVFTDLVKFLDLTLDPAAVWADYRRRLPGLLSCTDADRAALVDFREAGWRIGIVTNGMVDNQEGKIRQLGLDALVDGWVISAEVGVRKPSRAIFDILADRLSSPLKGWMVGDSLEADILGGHAAGLRTALVYGSEGVEEVGPADLVVPTVAEAAARILAGGS